MTTKRQIQKSPETFAEQSARIRLALSNMIESSEEIREKHALELVNQFIEGETKLSKFDSLETLHRKAFLHCYNTLFEELTGYDNQPIRALSAKFPASLMQTLMDMKASFDKMVPKKGDDAFELPTEIEPEGTIRRNALKLSQREGFEEGEQAYADISRVLKEELKALNKPEAPAEFSTVSSTSLQLLENMDAIVASLKTEVGQQRSFER